MTKRQYKFIRTKAEIKALRNVLKRFKSGEHLTISDQNILYDNGLRKEFDVKFFDQDQDNVIRNLVTVVMDSRISRIPTKWYSYAAFKVMRLRQHNRMAIKVNKLTIEKMFKYQPFTD
jgi:hypothetical protein